MDSAAGCAAFLLEGMPAAMMSTSFKSATAAQLAHNVDQLANPETVEYMLAQATTYEPKQHVVYCEPKPKQTADCTAAYHWFSSKWIAGEITFDQSSVTVRFEGGFSQEKKKADKELYPFTAANTARNDSLIEQAEGIVLLDFGKDNLLRIKHLCGACPGLDKIRIRAINAIATALSKNPRDIEITVVQLIRPHTFSGLEFHNDKQDFEDDKKKTTSPDVVYNVLLACPDKSMLVGGAQEEAVLKQVGSAIIFGANMFHRSGDILRQGCMMLSFLCVVKKTSRVKSEKSELGQSPKVKEEEKTEAGKSSTHRQPDYFDLTEDEATNGGSSSTAVEPPARALSVSENKTVTPTASADAVESDAATVDTSRTDGPNDAEESEESEPAAPAAPASTVAGGTAPPATLPPSEAVLDNTVVDNEGDVAAAAPAEDIMEELEEDDEKPAEAADPGAGERPARMQARMPGQGETDRADADEADKSHAEFMADKNRRAELEAKLNEPDDEDEPAAPPAEPAAPQRITRGGSQSHDGSPVRSEAKRARKAGGGSPSRGGAPSAEQGYHARYSARRNK